MGFGGAGGGGRTKGERQATGFVVACGDEDTLGVGAFDEINNRLEGLVVLEHLADLGGRVVDVAGVVDAAALNHEEEALVAVLGGLLKRRQRRQRHLAEAGVHVGHVAAVDLKRHVTGGKQAKQRQRDVLAQFQGIKPGAVVGVRVPVLLLRNLGDIDVVQSAAAGRRIGEKVAPPAAKDQIDGVPQDALPNLLHRNLVLLRAVVDMRRKARGRRVGDVGRHHQARRVAGALGGLEHGAAGLVVGRHGNGRVVALEAARKGRGAGGRVGDEAVARQGPRGAPEVLVQDERVGPVAALEDLAEGARQGQRGGAHAVRDHENEVLLGGLVGV